MWLPFIGPIIERVVGVVDKLIPDADMAATIKAEATLAAMQLDYREMHALIESRAKVIAAEYTDGSWLSRSWRPITMLVFTGVVGFNYLLAPIASLDPIPMPTALGALEAGSGWIPGGTECREDRARSGQDHEERWRRWHGYLKL
jgi:hypothetical protein